MRAPALCSLVGWLGVPALLLAGQSSAQRANECPAPRLDTGKQPLNQYVPIQVQPRKHALARPPPGSRPIVLLALGHVVYTCPTDSNAQPQFTQMHTRLFDIGNVVRGSRSDARLRRLLTSWETDRVCSAVPDHKLRRVGTYRRGPPLNDKRSSWSTDNVVVFGKGTSVIFEGKVRDSIRAPTDAAIGHALQEASRFVVSREPPEVTCGASLAVGAFDWTLARDPKSNAVLYQVSTVGGQPINTCESLQGQWTMPIASQLWLYPSQGQTSSSFFKQVRPVCEASRKMAGEEPRVPVRLKL